MLKMADTQKGASSTKSKEKMSLLDLDIGKDFLTSWKSMSVTEDDAMDFELSSVAKGKKKKFNFDNADMDFTLDGDFDKITSFKVDMSDLDVSSSPKKAGRPKEKSKEKSADGNSKGKTDRFTFSFDFNEFDSFNFESSPRKKDKPSNKNQESEKSSSISGSQGSEIHLNKDNSAFEEDITLKHGASQGEKTTSKADTELDSSNKDELHNVTNDNYLSKTAIGDEVGIVRAQPSPEKSISNSTQDTNQENCLQEKIMSPESYAQETGQDLSVQSVSGNMSTQSNTKGLQEIVSSLATKESTGTGDEINVVKLNCSSFSYDNSLLDKMAPDMACSESNNDENRKFEGVNHVQVGNKDGVELDQGDLQFEQTSITSVSRELLHGKRTDDGILDLTSTLTVAPLNSVIKIDNGMPEKERETGVIQSIFFKKSDETKSQLKQSSLSKIKLTTFGSKSIGTVQLSPADEREIHTKGSQSGSKLTTLQRSLPREPTRGESVQTKCQGSINYLNTTREDFDADEAKTGKSRLHDKDMTRSEFVLPGSENNIKDFSVSSQVQPSSSNDQAHQYASQHCLNPKLAVSGMTSIQNVKIICAGKINASPLKSGGRISDLSGLKIMRTAPENCSPLKSTLQKDVKSLSYSKRSMELKGVTESKVAHSADTENQKPPSPTLKRKALEESSADILTLKPLKRLSESPSESRSLVQPFQRIVDKQVYNIKNPADGNSMNVFNNCQSPRLHIPREVNLKEFEFPWVMDNDANVEKANACAKKLEDICKMLKKKHEEAKEILVRAIVNNNNLLMLKHPIYEEKICEVQKFAASLMSE